jgi:hypothetical protein
MNQDGIGLLLLFLIAGGVFSLVDMMRKQRVYQRSLDIKLDALLKSQGVEWPTLSPEVQSLALDPNTKIAAIKRLRVEKPEFSLAEAKAKAKVEAFAASVEAAAARKN